MAGLNQDLSAQDGHQLVVLHSGGHAYSSLYFAKLHKCGYAPIENACPHPFLAASLFAASSCDAACFFTFQVQLVSGASPLAYWVSTYLWDVLLFFVLSCLVMLTFAAYGRDASKVKPNQFDRAKHDHRTEVVARSLSGGESVCRACVCSVATAVCVSPEGM